MNSASTLISEIKLISMSSLSESGNPWKLIISKWRDGVDFPQSSGPMDRILISFDSKSKGSIEIIFSLDESFELVPLLMKWKYHLYRTKY